MKKELVWKMVQEQIGYDFKNLDLLQQAFTRRSYTAENGGENNEVLEFIGDKALDFVIVKLLIQKYGHLANGDPVDGTKLSAWEQEFKRNQEGYEAPAVNSFGCDYDEDDLSKIKSRMVNKKALARRMDELGFSEHLIMGKGDIQNNINQEDSVKEDLFEAIIGAVAIDSGWNLKDLQKVVEVMLVPEDFLINDTDTNYVRLIQEWEMNKNGCIPWYKYKEASYTSTWYLKESNTIYQNVADGLFCREIDGLFCRSSPDIIVRRRCVLSHKRRGWLQPSPSFRYSRNLALQDELYHPVINNGPAVLVCVDKRLGTGPVNQSRDAG